MGQSLTRAKRNIQWIETTLKIPDGKFIGQPFILSPWQKRDFIKVYDNPAGTRQAIFSFARKNGKTALAAAIVLLHFIGPESCQNSEGYSAARTRDQAALVFHYARKMIEQNHELSTIINVIKSQKIMECEARGTLFKALAADGSSAMGLNPRYVIHDELGQVKGPIDDMYDAMESAMGAQEDPLSLVISTQAGTDDDLLSVLIDDALSGVDPTRIASVYTADGVKEPFTMAGLEAANPGLHEFMNVKETLNNMRQAERLPSKRATFENLNLNMRVEANDAFINKSEWDKLIGEVPDMGECQALYGGLDLSRTTDLTAFVIVGYLEGKYYAYPHFWLPAKGLKERSEIQRIPYFTWKEQGYLDATPGSIIDRKYATDYIYSIYEKHSIEKIAYDSWDYAHIVKDLQRSGFKDWQVDPEVGETEEMLFEMFRQGFVTMSPALRTVEEIILDGHLVHSNHPVLNFNMANAQVLYDSTGNRKLDKSHRVKTIDGAVAMVMALSLAHREHSNVDDDDFKLTSLFDEDDLG